MALQRGDVVLIPFPFADLSAAKTRPGVVVSSGHYHTIRPELLVAYVSSQITKAHPSLDHVLVDWARAGLLKPSFVRPKLAAIEPALVVHHVGRLSSQDLLQVDRRLRQALFLNETVLSDIVKEIDLTEQPAALVQALAEKSITAITLLAGKKATGVNLESLRQLLAV